MLSNHDVCLPPLAEEPYYILPIPILQMDFVVFLGCGSQHSAFERAWTTCAGVRKESSRLRPGNHQVCVRSPAYMLLVSVSQKCPVFNETFHTFSSFFAGTLWYQEHLRRFWSTSWRPWGWTYITVNQVAEWEREHIMQDEEAVRAKWILNRGFPN